MVDGATIVAWSAQICFNKERIYEMTFSMNYYDIYDFTILIQFRYHLKQKSPFVSFFFTLDSYCFSFIYFANLDRDSLKCVLDAATQTNAIIELLA